MRLLTIIFLLIPVMANAMDAIVDFEVADGQLTATYTFSENIDKAEFSFSTDEELQRAFPGFSKNVAGTQLQLKTVPLEQMLTGGESPVFSHDSGNTLIYSPFFDVTHGYLGNEVKTIERFTFRFQGRVLHTRLLSDRTTFERFLVLVNNPARVHRGVHADIIIDDDTPDQDVLLEKMERSLSYLTENLGPAKERPTIFFTYSSSTDLWYDGRVVLGSPVVMMAISKGLELEADEYNVVLHHALLSHEIAHHWNARNIPFDDRTTQEQIDQRAWIHEGGAEAIAHLMTKDLFAAEMGEYVSFMRTNNTRQCETPEEYAAWEYNCGDVMYGLALGAPGVDPWKVLREIRELPRAGEHLVFMTFVRNAGQAVLNEITKIHATRPK